MCESWGYYFDCWGLGDCYASLDVRALGGRECVGFTGSLGLQVAFNIFGFGFGCRV